MASLKSSGTDASNRQSGVQGVKTRWLRLELIDTWGDEEVLASTPTTGSLPSRNRDVRIGVELMWNMQVGITGIEVIDQHGMAVPLSGSAVSLHGTQQGVMRPLEDCTISRIVDGCNLTLDEANMWSMELLSPLVISIDLGFPRVIFGVKIYNYNASINESFRGVKHLQLYVDPGDAGRIREVCTDLKYLICGCRYRFHLP